jgi:hypothetical protein
MTFVVYFEEHEWHLMPAIAVAALVRPPPPWQHWNRQQWFAWAR